MPSIRDDDRYTELVGRHAILPLVGRRLEIIADDYIDPEFGTGALKVTPGHDINDFEMGRKHGLEEISVIGEDGRLNDAAPEAFQGLAGKEAIGAVVAALREEGRLRSEEPYTHSVPFSHRSGERIEPLISLQWFCRMDELAKPAIDVVERDEVRIQPEQWKRVYLDWMNNIRPWCISRQLWWGHRIPVWYCDACEETIVAESTPERCGACDGPLRQDEDVLDTWFSSALWPFATLGWPDEDAPELRAFYPTDFLTTARDILFLWVARMVMMGLEFPGKIPFDDVYVHSVIQAPDGRRMSKSLGNGIDPLDEIAKHGADALRFGLLAMSSTQDVRFSEAKVQQGRDLANKLWNASRLVLLNVKPVLPSAGSERLEDRWILSRMQRAVADVDERIEAFDFAHAAQVLYRFIWSEFCDWYLEIVKPRLYDGDEDASATLLHVLESLLALVHPVMPFVSEEIYSYLQEAAEGAGVAPNLVIHRFPEVDPALVDEAAERELGAAIEQTQKLRRWRDLAGVRAGAVLSGSLDGGSAPHELVGRLARFEFSGSGEPVASVGGVAILASEEIDAEQVRSRLEERRVQLRAEVERGEGKLANQGFVAKAPPEVVEEERRKLDAYRAELEELG